MPEPGMKLQKTGGYVLLCHIGPIFTGPYISFITSSPYQFRHMSDQFYVTLALSCLSPLFPGPSITLAL